MTMIDGENKMDSRKELFRQTLTVALGVALCAAVMVGVFALLGYFDMTVVWGALAGSLIAVGNFFAMGMTTTLAAEKAANQDAKAGKSLISSSYAVRMLVMFAVLFACAKSGSEAAFLPRGGSGFPPCFVPIPSMQTPFGALRTGCPTRRRSGISISAARRGLRWWRSAF
jgi:hypothetical protein